MAARHMLACEITNKEALNSVMHDKERVLVRSGKKTIGAFVTAEELEILEEIERREDEIDRKKVLKAREDLKTGKQKLIPWEEVKKNLELSDILN
ncbi:MAG: hypothetical protein LBI42_07540 [Chitinispirillales bacterium]|jgi:hypothetical protein|nr:hypothetical protein [Chitinispirillales bacterium]